MTHVYTDLDDLKISNHPTSLDVKKINQICKPLEKYLNTTFFRHMILYKDGTRTFLTNIPEIMSWFYEDGAYMNTLFDSRSFSDFPTSSETCWSYLKQHVNDPKNLKLGLQLANEYNFREGNAFITVGSNNVEFFEFAASSSDIYQIDRKYFLHFIRHYKQVAHNLIQSSKQARFVVPNKTIDSIGYVQPPNFDFDNFMRETTGKTDPADFPTYESSLTEREIACTYWCSEGKSNEETAMILGISKRTVEIHLANAKRKLNCYKNTQLIKTAMQHGLL